MRTKNITIIGAGPIGLETALYAQELGYEVTIFEKGNIAENIQSWGHVRLFSPFAMNHSPLGLQLLHQHNPEWQQPDENVYLTGIEFVEAYLKPLSQLPEIRQNLKTETRVITLSRNDVLKGEFIGRPERAERPFRILTEDKTGQERINSADIIIDTSGVYDMPNWLGSGGIPAVGERNSRPHIDYHLKDIYGKDREKFANKSTLLVGSGYSAATAVIDFENLIREEPKTSLLWIVRGFTQNPIPVIEGDQLEGREGLTTRANRIAKSNTTNIEFKNQTSIEAIQYFGDKREFTVELRRKGEVETLHVDNILANVGYGPDNSIYRELQIHECYASRGPMKLSAALLGSTSDDCLTQQSLGAETLKNPEPNFFIIGSKSYGRNSTFLIRTGLSQIVEVFSLINGNPELNLYKNPIPEEVN